MTEKLSDGRPARRLAEEFRIREEYAENIVRLLDEGATVPFIARYRKELTGAIDDQVLREFGERLVYLRNLDKRKKEVLASIGEQGKLTPELEAALASASLLAEVEDLYRPFRPKRRTRASAAREKGLEGLAALLFSQSSLAEPEELAAPYVKPGQGAASAEEALAGASDILAEDMSDHAGARAALRTLLLREGVLRSSALTDRDSVYRLYYDFREPVARIPGYRVLAINRGEREELLKVSVECDGKEALARLAKLFVKAKNPSGRFVERAAADAWKRLLAPSLERETREELTGRANEGAIRMFSMNLKNVLLAPPVRGKTVLALDPAYRTGCKVAVVDPTGRLLETAVVYPTPPQSKVAEAEALLLSMVERHKVDVLSIGNGTASGETELFAAGLVKKSARPLVYAVVSEAGASVYSASKLAAEEFPDFDVSLRSAVSIGRRLQDPLAELVKIDPKSIGVGQYQHDLPSARLDEALAGVVEDCVNAVGVDLNTASVSLLSHISGLNAALASNIVARREEEGPFRTRAELKKVKRMGPKAFEQCAGFLRIPDGEEPLDATGVHPESYEGARRLLRLFHKKPNGAADLPALLAEREEAAAEACGLGLSTLRDIARELAKPGRDPRDELPPPTLRSDVLDITDLKPGMELAGTVRNVVDFGVFVDIGVHQDGLVHISRLADRFVRHPSEVVRAGESVKVTVVEVDVPKKRISLSMKAEGKRVEG